MIDVASLRAVAPGLSERFGLKLVLLFGSQVGGRVHAQSDVDLGVMSDHPLRPKELAEIIFYLTQALKLPDIEVTDLKTLPPLMLKNIAEESILLYEGELDLYDRFKIYGYKRHMEAGPLYRARARELKQFLAKT